MAEPFLDNTEGKWSSPNWGTSLRGVTGRNPGDYSSKVRGTNYQSPQMAGTFQTQNVAEYDPHNTNQRWLQPGFKSFARKNLSRPGYVPTVEEF